MTLVVPPEYNNNGQPAPAQPVVILDGTGAIVSAFGGGSGGSGGGGGTVVQGAGGVVSSPWFVEISNGTAANGSSAPLFVSMVNLPATQPISGTISVGNLPGTQPISGTVAISNLPATQQVSGSVTVSGGVSVNNLPASQAVTGAFFQATQPISGTVSVGGGSITVSNLPATQPVSGSVSVSGSVAVSNLPATQAVSGTVTVSSGSVSVSGGTVSVSNLPATQPVSGTVSVGGGSVSVAGAVSVSNLPATQAVSGSVAVSNLPTLQSTADVTLPDVVSGAQSLNGGTVGNIVTIPTASGKATNRVTISGLTGSGATLAPMASGVSTTAGFLGTTVNTTPAGTTVTSITTDGVYVFRCAATAAVQLAVAVAGSGTITVNSVQSSAPDAVVVTGSALPIGAATATAQGTGNTSLASLVAALSGAGVIATRTPIKLTMTYVTVPASTTAATRVSALNGTRKSIQILNIGTGFASTVSNATTTTTTTVPTLTGTTPFVPGAGYPLEPAASAGHQGGSTPIYDGVNTSTDAWDAISTTGTTLLVIEGN